MEVLSLIGRDKLLFENDILNFKSYIDSTVQNSKFLVIGGAGSIGQSVSKEIFKRDPKLLHVVDISENNLVELVRELRSTKGYIAGEFKTFAIDCGSTYFERLVCDNQGYDYVLNLSALKHVRSEKDPYTLMRMLDVNIFNTISVLEIVQRFNVQKYFCVSTDKAANPVNLMGASKRIMELFLFNKDNKTNVSMARFANVAFSDGSLLHGFNQRFAKKQPIAAPIDTLRYFLTPQESGELCLLSCLLGEDLDIFFPKLTDQLQLERFSNIARRFVKQYGYKVLECDSEEYARENASTLIGDGYWPCYFFKSDTSGEKGFEEFYTVTEDLDLNTFEGVGVIKKNTSIDMVALEKFKNDIKNMKLTGSYNKERILHSVSGLLDNFKHIETGKSLDNRM